MEEMEDGNLDPGDAEGPSLGHPLSWLESEAGTDSEPGDQTMFPRPCGTILEMSDWASLSWTSCQEG